MNSNTYIQYLTRSGLVKTVEVETVEEAQFVKFTVSGIQEEFFLLNLFDNNKKIDGLTFDNVQNLQMLSFLNSDFQTVEVIPDNFYMNAFDVVVISLDRSALPAVSNSVVVDNFPATQNVNVTNQPTQIAVSNFPPTQNVNVTNQPTQIAVSNFPATQNVNVTNQPTQIAVSNFPSTQNVNVNNVPTVIIQNSNIFKVYYQSAAKNFIINDLPENAKNLILQASTLLTFTVNTSVVPKLIQYVDSNSFSTTYDLFCGTATTDIEVSIDGVGWINVPRGQVFIAKKIRGKSTGTGALGQITGYQLYL